MWLICVGSVVIYAYLSVTNGPPMTDSQSVSLSIHRPHSSLVCVPFTVLLNNVSNYGRLFPSPVTQSYDPKGHAAASVLVDNQQESNHCRIDSRSFQHIGYCFDSHTYLSRYAHRCDISSLLRVQRPLHETRRYILGYKTGCA